MNNNRYPFCTMGRCHGVEIAFTWPVARIGEFPTDEDLPFWKEESEVGWKPTSSMRLAQGRHRRQLTLGQARCEVIICV